VLRNPSLHNVAHLTLASMGAFLLVTAYLRLATHAFVLFEMRP
jgi:hypothetical protein